MTVTVPRDLTILVVEDDSELRDILRMTLELDGYRVIEAPSGLHALREVDVEKPDLVVLDLGLPLISGEAVREQLADWPETRHIPVVILTTREGPYDGLNAACVLRKPIEPEALLRAVRACLAEGAHE